jgi:hypothetical protein
LWSIILETIVIARRSVRLVFRESLCVPSGDGGVDVFAQIAVYDYFNYDFPGPDSGFVRREK